VWRSWPVHSDNNTRIAEESDGHSHVERVHSGLKKKKNQKRKKKKKGKIEASMILPDHWTFLNTREKRLQPTLFPVQTKIAVTNRDKKMS
jgi:hypothetical protein